MELFIFIALHLLTAVQSSEYPKTKVSPDVVRESNSVHLICETPADVTASLCYFYAHGEKEKDIKLSPSCRLSLTGAEVLLWTGVKSPLSLDIGCYYTVKVSEIYQPSHHSPPATLTILDALVKPVMSVDDSSAQITVSCEIPMSVRTDFICKLYTEDEPIRHRSHSQRTQSGANHCLFYISHSEIFTHKKTVNSRQMSCDYSVKTDPEMNLTSPRSDVYTIRGFPPAVLRASSSVITDRDTVQLDCMNRENLKMDTCFFTVDGIESNTKQSKSCQLSLTESDIIHWSGGQRSSVIITCFYAVRKTQVPMPSPKSDPVTVTVWKFCGAVLRASSSVITDTDTVQLNCTNNENLKMDTCFFTIDGSHFRESRSCQLSLTGSDISRFSGGQRSSVIITCFYSAQSHGFASSPKSDLVTVTVQILTTFTSAQTPTMTSTVRTTYVHQTPQDSASVSQVVGSSAIIKPHHTMGTTTYRTAAGPTTTRDSALIFQEMWIKILSGAVMVFLLTGLICLCRYVCKERTKHQGTAGDTCASGPAEAYSMVTSVPNTSQHTDAVVKENVYHIYCTIPDKPVNVAAGSQNYSLAH